jgi:putative ABC transport system permease protein
MNLRWLMKMAWRDSRRNRGRLLLFISSIILGIAALVAIQSLGENMRHEIDAQASTLLGADLEITSNKEVTPQVKKMLDSIGQRRSEERRFTSMVYFTNNGGTRLVQVRALGGEFPYYGRLESDPINADKQFRTGQQALVDQTLMLQFGAKAGDSIQVGNLRFAIAGSLLSAPGQTGISASVAPIVYIPLRYVEATGLSQKGSRINYRYYFMLKSGVNGALIKRILDADLNYETVTTQKQETNRSLRDLTKFLSLISFIALLLGCVGVASAIHIFVREKINTVAILRCLGATGWQAFTIFLIQILVVGFLGSVAGAVVGTLIQQLLPIVLSDLLPVKINPSISWTSIWQGILLGLVISFLFALLPLISVRNVSPLNTLRLSLQPIQVFKDPAKWFVYALIMLFIFTFTFLQLSSLMQAISFTIGIVLFFLLLLSMAWLITYTTRKFFPSRWSYLWRQGLANLFRPNNQTAILIVSIGLGTTFICTLFSIQSILLNRVTLSASGNQPNTVLFDIQSAQKDSVLSLTRQQGLPVDGTVPIVNMRLERINNITADVLEKNRELPMQRWVFTREYRVTYRDSLTASEELVRGEFTGTASGNRDIFISVEHRFAERNNIKVGDTMVFNVQGSIISTIVGSLREVDWNRIQTNFLIVFPTGVLEQAPQFHVIMTRTENKEASAKFQQKLVQQFPNVSVIDLTLVLSILDNLLEKVGFVVKFMAGFSIITGLLVLIASVLISKYQRVQESVLLRTIGASRRQIFFITAIEYFLLGVLAAATGIVLSIIGSWALAEYIFDTKFTPDIWSLLGVVAAVSLLTMLIGLANSRGVVGRPPLEILREQQ